MHGLITAFRGSHKTKRGNHLIVLPEGVDSREKAKALEGRRVQWANPEGKKKLVISGSVRAAHGGNGAVRVIFERGLPGQALGTKVDIT